MLIISDTNILSSMAAGAGFHLLSRLFLGQVIYIPPAVQKELLVGFRAEQMYLDSYREAAMGRYRARMGRKDRARMGGENFLPILALFFLVE